MNGKLYRIGCDADLAADAKGTPKPAVLVFGDVVGLSRVLPRYRYEPKEVRHAGSCAS